MFVWIYTDWNTDRWVWVNSFPTAMECIVFYFFFLRCFFWNKKAIYIHGDSNCRVRGRREVPSSPFRKLVHLARLLDLVKASIKEVIQGWAYYNRLFCNYCIEDQLMRRHTYSSIHAQKEGLKIRNEKWRSSGQAYQVIQPVRSNVRLSSCSVCAKHQC